MREVRILQPGDDRTMAVRSAAESLASGEILAHPTLTVYGLGAVDPDLDAEIGRLKGREAGRPLIRIGPDARTLRERHPELAWTARAERLAGDLWPGPLTLVLDDGGPDGLGIRVEGHELTREVLVEAGETMSSTSLNRTGEAPARDPEGVDAALAAMPPARVPVTWLDAGPLPGAPPSTVLSLREDPPRLLRPGAVPVDRLEDVLEEEVVRG